MKRIEMIAEGGIFHCFRSGKAATIAERSVPPTRAKRLMEEFADCIERLQSMPYVAIDEKPYSLRVLEGGKMLCSTTFLYGDEQIENMYKKFADIFQIKNFLRFFEFDHPNEKISEDWSSDEDKEFLE